MHALKSTPKKGVYGDSPDTRALLHRAAVVADTDVPVLLLGESGTGKGVIARSIHEMSGRANGPFIQVNCGGLRPELVDSELFGHERGAFTGAVRARAGAFELADSGTLFLDEIGDLSMDCQAHLLHILQDGTMRRLGGEAAKTVNVRILAATNRDLGNRVDEGEFRQDLFFRVAVFTIEVPPLRQRMADLPSLIEHFVEQSSHRAKKPVPTISAEAMERLMAYNWPGNIRELEHAILAAIVVAGPVVEPVHLPFLSTVYDREPTQSLPTLDEYQRDYIRRVLSITEGVVDGDRGAARILGLNPSTLRSRMVRLKIPRRGWD